MNTDHTPPTRGEETLRTLLSEASVPGRIDTGGIIRRSRRRRRARTFTAASVGALAAVGIVAAAVGGIQMPVLQTASESADSGVEPAHGGSSIFETEVDDGQAGDSTADALSSPAPLETLNSCGSPPADIAREVSALAVTPRFTGAPVADGSTVTGSIVLENRGTEAVRGTIVSGPALTLAHDDRTVWHSEGASPQAGAAIDLAPGESFVFDAELPLVECSPDDESGEGIPADRPPLAPGDYLVTAALQFAPSAGDGDIRLVVSEPQPLTLR